MVEIMIILCLDNHIGFYKLVKKGVKDAKLTPFSS